METTLNGANSAEAAAPRDSFVDFSANRRDEITVAQFSPTGAHVPERITSGSECPANAGQPLLSPNC